MTAAKFEHLLRIPKGITTFGVAVRWAREQRRKTLRQVCREVGFSPPFLSDLEHDRRQTTKVAELATALGVDLADLERRQGVTEDLTDWLSKNPKLIALLRDIRACRCPMPRLK